MGVHVLGVHVEAAKSPRQGHRSGPLPWDGPRPAGPPHRQADPSPRRPSGCGCLSPTSWLSVCSAAGLAGVVGRRGRVDGGRATRPGGGLAGRAGSVRRPSPGRQLRRPRLTWSRRRRRPRSASPSRWPCSPGRRAPPRALSRCRALGAGGGRSGPARAGRTPQEALHRALEGQGRRALCRAPVRVKRSDSRASTSARLGPGPGPRSHCPWAPAWSEPHWSHTSQLCGNRARSSRQGVRASSGDEAWSPADTPALPPLIPTGGRR